MTDTNNLAEEPPFVVRFSPSLPATRILDVGWGWGSMRPPLHAAALLGGGITQRFPGSGQTWV